MVSTTLLLCVFSVTATYVFSEKNKSRIQSSLESPVSTTTPETPTPTFTPSPTPTLTPTPTFTPTPTIKPKPTIIKTPPVSSSGGLSDLLSQVNQYRKDNGLPSVVSNAETCSFAKLRAQEVSSDFSHAGFTNRVNNHTLPYTYHEVTENIAMNSNQNDVVPEWIKSPGHAENMRKNTPYVCIEKFGEYYVYEGLRP